MGVDVDGLPEFWFLHDGFVRLCSCAGRREGGDPSTLMNRRRRRRRRRRRKGGEASRSRSGLGAAPPNEGEAWEETHALCLCGWSCE
jgi:hypothetical protein